MIKQFIIPFLILNVTCSAQEVKQGTIKVKKADSAQSMAFYAGPDVRTPLVVAEQMPVFPGGNQEMYVFIQKNIKYPEDEKKKGIKGTAYVTFVVDTNGTILDVKMLRGISGGPGCDEEAMRVVKMMPKWTAGRQNGKNVAVQCTLPIKFAL
jgi:TonB family protein